MGQVHEYEGMYSAINNGDEGKSREAAPVASIEFSDYLNFIDYQESAYQHIKPHETPAMEIVDWGLGLGGEAGEVQELIKHNIMHKEPIDEAKLAKEIGDVLWYCAALCSVYDLNMGVVAELNLAKLEHRHGQNYSVEGSAQRHAKEEKFSDTEYYKALIACLKTKGVE